MTSCDSKQELSLGEEWFSCPLSPHFILLFPIQGADGSTVNVLIGSRRLLNKHHQCKTLSCPAYTSFFYPSFLGSFFPSFSFLFLPFLCGPYPGNSLPGQLSYQLADFITAIMSNLSTSLKVFACYHTDVPLLDSLLSPTLAAFVSKPPLFLQQVP